METVTWRCFSVMPALYTLYFLVASLGPHGGAVQAESKREFVVFGDSLCDNGKLFADAMHHAVCGALP